MVFPGVVTLRSGLISQNLPRINKDLCNVQFLYMGGTGQVLGRAVTLKSHPVMGLMKMMVTTVFCNSAE